jgi:hypothetical protein
MYEDGSDGVARDDEKSMQATARAAISATPACANG